MKITIASVPLAACLVQLVSCSSVENQSGLQRPSTAVIRSPDSANKTPELTPDKKSSSVQIDSQAALIVGHGDSFVAHLKADFQLPLGLQVTALYVERADGKKVHRVNSVAKLSAGKHQLQLRCDLRFEGLHTPVTSNVEAELENGHVYEIVAHAGPQSCATELNDVTSIVAEFPPR
jgi:phage terminase large subunit-like protein